MKYGVADYGMNVWDGACYDIEARLERLKAIGYDGVERVYAVSADDALHKAARYKRLGMDFATCLGPNPELSIQWTAGLGKAYIWIPLSPRDRDMDTFCRHSRLLSEACERWGITAALHNHMGTRIEAPGELEHFLKECPRCGLVLDTAHLAAVDGDPVAIVRRYADRLSAVHLKDWLVTNPEVGLDRWPERGRFCGLGKGNIGLDNIAVMKALREVGYDGWVFVEQDTHLQDPFVDLKESREHLSAAGS